MEEKTKFKGMNVVVFIIFLVALLVVGIVVYNMATKQNNVSGKLDNSSSNQEEIKDIKSIEEPDNISIKVKYVKQETVWNKRKDEDYYYIKICGYDENGKEVWSYSTREDKNDSQYGRIEYIGTYNEEIVLLNEFGTLKALDFKAGKELWSNSEYGGFSSKQITDTKGNIYLYSNDQGKIFEINKQGKTLKNLKINEDLAPNETEPEISIIYNNGNAEKIQMQWTEPAGLWDDDYHREFVLTIDLQSNKMDRTVKKIPISNNNEVQKVEKIIQELKAKGYHEIERKNYSFKLHSSDNPNYKYEIAIGLDDDDNVILLHIDASNKMFINDKDTGYKYKMAIGDEYFTIIVTEDDYLYNPDKLKMESSSKIKAILEFDNNDTGCTEGSIVFEDGNIFEYTID